VLHAVLRGGYRPRVIVAEFSRDVHPRDAFTVQYAPDRMWTVHEESSMYMGASLSAFYRLFRAFGYHLLAADQYQVNVFAVHADEVGPAEVVSLDEVILGVQEGKGWCSRLHGATSRVWVEITDNVPLTEAREEWYDALPRWNLTCLGVNEGASLRLLTGAQLEPGANSAPAPWIDAESDAFTHLSCAPMRDVTRQVLALIENVQ
jgi:hypothetical protein